MSDDKCYSSHAEVPLVNALDECRAERDKLREGSKEIAEAVRIYVDQHGPADCHVCYERMKAALTTARELGLLEEK